VGKKLLVNHLVDKELLNGLVGKKLLVNLLVDKELLTVIGDM
jgi:hypothetical protein